MFATFGITQSILGVMRLRDLGRPAWHLLLAAVPIVGFKLVMEMLWEDGVGPENPEVIMPENEDRT